MNNPLAQAPKYFRSPVSRGGQPRVDRSGGYRGAGIIRGVSVITKGEALGHQLWIDDVTLEQVAGAINVTRHGIKSRFTHPSMSGDGLGKHVGRIRDAEVNGEQVFADQHFNESAHRTPDGNLADYLMTLAEEDPESYGLSISFNHDAAAMDQFTREHLDASGSFRSPDPANVNNYPHVRILELHAADAVDEPAANPNGLFHREHDVAREADALAAYALGISATPPETTELGLSPDRVRGFVSRFLTTHQLEVKSMADEQAAEPTEAAPEMQPETEAQPEGIKVGDRVAVKAGSEHDESHAGLVGTVTEESTPALGVRFDNEPETVYRWYTADELEPAGDESEAPAEAPAEPAETETSRRDEAQQYRAAFGDKGAIWYAEGLTFEQCRERQISEMRTEIEQLKTKLASRPLDGEDSPVTFDAKEQKRSGFVSNYQK